MSTVKNMIGLRFGKLVVTEYAGQDHHRKATWKCSCDCGNETTTTGSRLRSKTTTSCGCHQRTVATTHGMSRNKTPEYKTWSEMLSRCRNPNVKGYINYGGRGITVCERWTSFEKFLEDMGQKPSPQHSIDRINNNGNYEPNNCRWATKHEQDTNRRQTRLFTIGGETLCLKDWAKRYDKNYDTLLRRINNGWSLETALNARPRYKVSRKKRR